MVLTAPSTELRFHRYHGRPRVQRAPGLRLAELRPPHNCRPSAFRTPELHLAPSNSSTNIQYVSARLIDVSLLHIVPVLHLSSHPSCPSPLASVTTLRRGGSPAPPASRPNGVATLPCPPVCDVHSGISPATILRGIHAPSRLCRRHRR